MKTIVFSLNDKLEDIFNSNVKEFLENFDNGGNDCDISLSAHGYVKGFQLDLDFRILSLDSSSALGEEDDYDFNDLDDCDDNNFDVYNDCDSCDDCDND